MVNRKKIWSKRYSLRLWENWCYGTKQFRELFGINFPNQRIFIDHWFGTGYVDADQLEKSMQIVLDKIYAQWFTEFFERKWVSIFDDFLAYCSNFQNINFATYSNDKLLKQLQEFLIREDEWMHYMWIIFLLDETLTYHLQKELSIRYPADQQANIIQALLSQDKKTDALQHKIDTLQIMADRQEGRIQEDIFQQKLAELTQKYVFFATLNMDEDPLTINYFTELVAELQDKWPATLQISRMQEAEENNINLSQEIFDKNKDDEKFYILLEACKKVWYYREWRNDIRQRAYFCARGLYIEIAKRLGLSIDQVIYLTRDEIQDHLLSWTQWYAPSSVIERKEHSLLEQMDGTIRYVFDPVEIQKLKPTATDNAQHIVKWTVAYQWLVTGTAKIIRDITKDKDSFNKGDILVATTTNLAFIPLITQASALVTDEWWLLSHTAIVARELKLPCIVGTGNATQVLKSGTTITVDATKGLIISQNL